jgi:hypothetical protein
MLPGDGAPRWQPLIAHLAATAKLQKRQSSVLVGKQWRRQKTVSMGQWHSPFSCGAASGISATKLVGSVWKSLLSANFVAFWCYPALFLSILIL